MLAWARDTTDFRPSMNGVGGACASRRTVWERGRERSRDGAGRLPDLWVSGPSVVACILAWARDATDFRPSIKRRCDCAGGRAQAVSVMASDVAPAQAVRRLPRFGKLALQLAPVACTHECNSHLCTLMTPQTVRDSWKDCFHGQFRMLTRGCRARATRRANTHPIGHIQLVQRIPPLALSDEKTAGAGTRDTAQQMHAGAI